MKKILLFACFAFGAAFSVSAQTPDAKAAKSPTKVALSQTEQARKEAAKLAKAQAIESGKLQPSASEKSKLVVPSALTKEN